MIEISYILIEKIIFAIIGMFGISFLFIKGWCPKVLGLLWLCFAVFMELYYFGIIEITF